MTVRIMFLDDNPERHKTMRKNCIGFAVSAAWNADEAIELLSKEEFDLIMLDHDLDATKENMIVEGEKDGRYVASKMIESDRHKTTPVILHSLNENGRDMMESILTNNGFENVHQLPFAWMMIEKDKDGGILFDPNKVKF